MNLLIAYNQFGFKKKLGTDMYAYSQESHRML